MLHANLATEMRSEGSQVNKIALPLLEEATVGLPLECWSMYAKSEDRESSTSLLLISCSQTESVDPRYQPSYTARDTYNRKVGLVVGLPVNLQKSDYERAGLNTPGKFFSHISHPYIGKRILGPGVEMKATDGNLVEAQVQLGVWIAGLLMWAFAQNKTVKDLPPLIGCTAVGDDQKFYIAVGVEGSGVLEEVVGHPSDYLQKLSIDSSAHLGSFV